MNRIDVTEIDSLNYPVYFGENPWKKILDFLGPFLNTGSVFILTDQDAYKYCYPVILKYLPGLAEHPVFKVVPGEASKNVQTLGQTWNWLMSSGADRQSLLINLGGGVITDLGGFAAATFKRGIPYVNIPTSLIGMADAAIGGKTGINIHRVKNQAGVFYDPAAVFIFPGFLDTLPENHLKSGIAEIIKAGVLSGGDSWQNLKAMNFDLKDDLVKLILQSVIYKCGIVAQDPFEKSVRKVLNFGHTVGHAMEGYYNHSGNKIMMHGDAVAAGMVCEAFISSKFNRLPDRELMEIVSVIQRVYNLHEIKTEDFGELLEMMNHDKKNTKEGLNFTLLDSIGSPKINCIVDQKIILDSFRYTNELIKQ